MSLWHRIVSAELRCLSHRCRTLHSLSAASPPAAADLPAGRRRLHPLETPLGFSPASLGSTFFGLGPARSFAAPVQAKTKSKEDAHAGPVLNESITARFVRLVTDEGHGIVSRWEALDRAKKLNLDLVEVDRQANPPVCKIMDYHKEKYQQELKEKERAKSKGAVSLRNGENKEVRFRGKTELKDLKIKAETVTRLMERGYRVKCTALPTGKEVEDLGDLLARVLSLIEDVSVVESGPHMSPTQAYVIVRHVKFEKKKVAKKISEIIDTIRRGGFQNTNPEAEGELSSEDVELDPQDAHTTTLGEASNVDFNNEIDGIPASITRIGSLKGKLDLKNGPAERSTVESNRYSKPSQVRGRFPPTDRNNMVSENRAALNKAGIPQQPTRNDMDRRYGQVDPKQRQLHPNNSGSPSPRFGNFISQKPAGFGDQSRSTERSSTVTDNRAVPDQVRVPRPPTGNEQNRSGQWDPKQRQVNPSNPVPPLPSSGVSKSPRTPESGGQKNYGIFSK